VTAGKELKTLSDARVERLDRFPVAGVDLRRDLYQLVRYVEERGLVRTKRGNAIPKTVARRLAKLLSYTEESKAVEEDGCGFWSDFVSYVAKVMGLVTFDTEGVYLGYSSTEPSYPDNEIKVNKKAWRTYLDKTPLKKEHALLDACCRLTKNEFFHRATLIDGERFDRFGSATGPAGAMDLPRIRRDLLQFFATNLEPGRWYEMRDVVALLEVLQPHLILDPDTREPEAASRRRLRDWQWGHGRKKKRPAKPKSSLKDIYTNFREYGGGEERWDHRSKRQITSRTADAFRRVEGRYLEYFLSEIPYICRFVELAFRPGTDRHGLDVSPELERLRAFRLTSRFFQVIGNDAELDRVKVTVLPTFEVLVEAPSYPDVILQALAPYTCEIDEDGPIHRLRLEQRKVVEAAARDPKAPSVTQVLEKLSGTPVPENVAVESSCWSKRGDKVVFYQGFGLLELDGESERQAVLEDVGELVADDRLDRFVLVREPERVFSRLEERLHVPIRVKHKRRAFTRCAGRLGAASEGEEPKRKKRGTRTKATPVRLKAEDLVGYRASDASLLPVLQEMLRLQTGTCVMADENLLVVSARDLPRVRAALRRLADRFEVTLEPYGG